MLVRQMALYKFRIIIIIIIITCSKMQFTETFPWTLTMEHRYRIAFEVADNFCCCCSHVTNDVRLRHAQLEVESVTTTSVEGDKRCFVAARRNGFVRQYRSFSTTYLHGNSLAGGNSPPPAPTCSFRPVIARI